VGPNRPVPENRVRILEDKAVSRWPFEIRAIATPGHASFHHVYHWDETIFGGDIAGVAREWAADSAICSA